MITIITKSGKWKKEVELDDPMFHPIIGVMIEEGLDIPNPFILGEGASIIIEEEWDNLSRLMSAMTLDRTSPMPASEFKLSRISTLLNITDSWRTYLYVDDDVRLEEKLIHYKALSTVDIDPFDRFDPIDPSLILIHDGTDVHKGILINAIYTWTANQDTDDPCWRHVMWNDVLELADEGSDMQSVALLMLGRGDIKSESWPVEVWSYNDYDLQTSAYPAILTNYEDVTDVHSLGISFLVGEEEIIESNHEFAHDDELFERIYLSNLVRYVNRRMLGKRRNLESRFLDKLYALDPRSIHIITNALHKYVLAHGQSHLPRFISENIKVLERYISSKMR